NCPVVIKQAEDLIKKADGTKVNADSTPLIAEAKKLVAEAKTHHENAKTKKDHGNAIRKAKTAAAYAEEAITLATPGGSDAPVVEATVALQAAIRPLPRQQQSHPLHHAPPRRALDLERAALRAAVHVGGLLSHGHRLPRPLLPPAAPVANFSGQVVLITGASSGIGEALAREFARRGAALVLAARRTDRLDRLVAELTAGGARAVAVRCDVTVDGEPERAAAAARERFGRLDVVVANAGFGV